MALVWYKGYQTHISAFLMVVAMLGISSMVTSSSGSDKCRIKGHRCGPGLVACCSGLRCTDLNQNKFGTCTEHSDESDGTDDEPDSAGAIDPVPSAVCRAVGEKCGPALLQPCCSGLQCGTEIDNNDFGRCSLDSIDIVVEPANTGPSTLAPLATSTPEIFSSTPCAPLTTSTMRTHSPPVNKDLLWPNNTVPYWFQPNTYTAEDKRIIREAMDVITKMTAGCIIFLELPNRDKNNDFVLFTKHHGCSSGIGRIGGSQEVSLVKDCLTHHGSVQRHLLRTLGLSYEHTRMEWTEMTTSRFFWKTCRKTN
ncbi:uncharacterized protein LOC129598485 [Paramacrobiotus metropolitanus]|uniref:uncharacterized protein LOC129598485 n=1 Tax=Paramacrobiotus metropolitanus TaxID=2943436 RepID=UPI0024465C74|nr:uncharacterized protein LOC129598485 [Paramacrobiotus metropolitanus]